MIRPVRVVEAGAAFGTVVASLDGLPDETDVVIERVTAHATYWYRFSAGALRSQGG
jgi:hypothetical protein